ncbi:PIN domain-containing protein [Pedobacter cryoconitis]|uniref:tRNA(fMet)-specific endonuclease VapC n=1 Tax=Pedobacter cryoconitis TaxID=188932 RepID=A0A327SPW6_9SPHI|nr:PIN domain-containing protein [Pedobacter cryoconitis]RAJ29533.1 tRNA(fMet)-specific endonuclease VapC [Pedobacter cryoconitis]
MQYLLDTSTCVFYLRGKLDLVSIIREKGRKNFFISEITVVELRFGAENSDNQEKAHKAVDHFVNGLSIIPIIGSINRYAKEKVRLRKMGKPINDEFDLLIGVTSVENNLILVTDNVKDFERIEDIQIENWYQR